MSCTPLPQLPLTLASYIKPWAMWQNHSGVELLVQWKTSFSSPPGFPLRPPTAPRSSPVFLGHGVITSTESPLVCQFLKLSLFSQDLDTFVLIKYFAAAASVVSDSVQPHRRQPTRLPRPWDPPGKNTGVGCRLTFNLGWSDIFS